MHSPFESVREVAREALAGCDFGEYLRDYDQLPPEERQERGEAAARVDARAGERLRGEMHAEEEDRRMRAVEIAKSLGLTPRLEADLVNLTQDPSAKIRSVACRALEGVVSVATARALGAAVTDDDARVRANTLETLATYRDPRLIGLFRMMARDRHNRVRTTACLALVSLKDAAGMEGLAEMARDPGERFRLSAAWALGRVQTDDARDLLECQASGDPSHRVRTMAERGLRRLGVARSGGSGAKEADT